MTDGNDKSRNTVRRTQSQENLTVQTGVTVALAAGGLSLMLAHDQHASSHSLTDAPATWPAPSDMAHGADLAGQHSAQAAPEAATSLAVSSSVAGQHSFAVEQSAAPSVSFDRAASTNDTPGDWIPPAGGAPVDAGAIHGGPSHSTEQPARADSGDVISIDAARAEPMHSIVDHALDMTTAALQAIGSVATGVVTSFTQVFAQAETAVADQIRGVDQLIGTSIGILDEASQLHGFDALIAPLSDEIADVAPALLGAVTANEGPPAEAIGALGGLAELAPIHLTFMGQSYAETHETSGLLHGFV